MNGYQLRILRKVDEYFLTESTYDKEPMDAVPLTGNSLQNS